MPTNMDHFQLFKRRIFYCNCFKISTLSIYSWIWIPGQCSYDMCPEGMASRTLINCLRIKNMTPDHQEEPLYISSMKLMWLFTSVVKKKPHKKQKDLSVPMTVWCLHCIVGEKVEECLIRKQFAMQPEAVQRMPLIITLLMRWNFIIGKTNSWWHKYVTFSKTLYCSVLA